MKLLKKALSLFAATILCLGMGVIAACDNDPENENSASVSDSSSSASSDEGITDDTNYRVGVQTINGYGLSNITVSLLDGSTLITSKKTESSGYVNFKEADVDLGTYTVRVDLPYGYTYAYDETYKTTTNKGMIVEIVLMPTGLVEGSRAPNGLTYKLGDAMYDFSMTTSDNQTFTLSQALKEKKMVLLNFWATWCGPCKSEFPAMSTAYTLYKDSVEVFAVSTTDTKASVSEFKSSEGLTFPMAHNQENFEARFPKAGIPLSVVIDRYGVICYWHNGSMTNASDFTELFDIFIADDYTPTVRGNATADDDGNDNTDAELVKPTVQPPALSDVKTVLGGEDFTYSWQSDSDSDEYSWPWAIGEDGGGKFLYASNRNVHNSYAQLFTKFTLTGNPKDKVLVFDLKLWTEGDSKDGDYFYVFIDEKPVQKLYGQRNGGDWSACYAYVFNEFEAGEHELVFIYQKDASSTAGDDTVQIKNIRFESLSSLTGKDMGYVFHYAAEGAPSAAQAEKQQFARYITPVYNEADGYYHVNDKDGPLLFVNLMGTTPWNESSVWLLAYNDYVVEDGFNYKSAIEDYAWNANNNMANYGYTPVTPDLRELLDITVRSVSVYNKWEGEYHENEWLETCAYYQHYGTTEALEDPMKNITFHSATELTVSMDKENPIENRVSVPFAINPRGFKYKFTPKQSGVYNIYSLGDSDTECWLVDQDAQTFLGFYQDRLTTNEKGEALLNNNFNFHYYLEGGRTYYLLCTTCLDTASVYDVVIAYEGETYTYWESAAPGDYSFNPVTGDTFINDCVEYVYDEENDVYRVQNEDGSMGEILYFNVSYMPKKWYSDSIQKIVEDALTVAPADRAFYADGVDYTDTIKKYSDRAMRNTGDLRGFVAINKELYDVLYALTTSAKYDGLENSWLFLCFYRATLGAQ